MKPPKPSKEQQILFDLMKGDHPTNLDGIDTAALFRLFRRHRLLILAQPLLPLLDKNEGEQWVQSLRQESMRTLGLVSRLTEVIDQFEQSGIEVLPLKGPVLAQTLYGDVGQRHMRDLDLLVSLKDMRRSLEILQEIGYVLKFPAKDLSPRQWRIYFRQQYDVGMIHREDGSLLELHTQIAYPGLLGGFEHLLTGELDHTEIAGRAVSCLSKEGTFLYLAIHGVHHLFFRLFWLRDLSEVLNRWDLDHRKIAAIAVQMGIERILGVGLRLAEYYFGARIPTAYLPLLEKDRNILDRMEIRCHYAISEPRFYGRRSRANVLLFSMDLKAGWRYRWQTLSSVIHRWYIRKILLR